MKKDSHSGGGIGFCRALTIAFIVLRLCHIIDWPWLIVLLPLLAYAVILIAAFIILFIAELRDRYQGKEKDSCHRD